MPKDFFIKISDFKGIFQTMAKIANGLDDNDKTLNWEETSIFNKIRALNKDAEKTGYFVFKGSFYDIRGEKTDYIPITEKPDALAVQRPKTKEEIIEQQEIDSKHQQAIEKADTVPIPQKEVYYKQLEAFSNKSSAKFPDDNIDYNILKQAFENVVKGLLERGKKTKSAILNEYDTFINASKDKKVNPITMMAISMQESAYGTSDWALGERKNVCGVHAKCNTVADSIYEGAQVLSDNVYGTVRGQAPAKQKNAYETIGEIGLKGNYCCGSNRSGWVKNVLFFSNLIQREYNKLLLEKQST